MINLLKKRWFIPLIMIISIAIILFIGGSSFAKYYHEKTNAESSGVAKFVINDKFFNSVNNGSESEVEFSTAQDLKPGDTLKYRIEVDNNSEVKVSYKIEITSTGNLPLYINNTKLSDEAILITKDIEPSSSSEIVIEIVWLNEYSSINDCGKIDVISFTFIAEQKL